VLASVGRRVVLLQHAGRDAPALTDRQAVLFRPGPDITAALTVDCGPTAPARLCPPGLAGVLKIGREARGLWRNEQTICTAVAPAAVFTITYGTRQLCD
jgi:hypothetical protein